MPSVTPSRHPQRLLALALAGLSALSAQATDSYQLRVLGLDFNSTLAADASYQGRDGFANGNPLQGMNYVNNGTGASAAGGYNTVAFSAGAEMTGAASDFLGSAFAPGLPIGGLSFTKPDGTPVVNNLVPAGYDATAIQLQLKSLPATGSPGGNQGLLFKNSGFDAFTVWNYAIPGLGGAFGTRVQTSSAADASFQDLIDLRVVTNTSGATTIRFERIAKDVAGSFVRTTLDSVSFAQVYAGNLADVDYISLSIERNPSSGIEPNPTLTATARFHDASLDANGQLTRLGTYVFSAHPTVFNDGNFGNVSARVGWLTAQPVPEPGSGALLLAGVATLAFAARRRGGGVGR